MSQEVFSTITKYGANSETSKSSQRLRHSQKSPVSNNRLFDILIHSLTRVLPYIPPENSRWDKYVSKLQVPGYPLSMAFHAFDNHLVVANETDMIGYAIPPLHNYADTYGRCISVWDWSKKKRLNYFCNGNPKNLSITALEIINQDVGGIIMTASGTYPSRTKKNLH